MGEWDWGQSLLALLAYGMLVAILAGLLHSIAPALVVAYILALGARLYKATVFTRTLLIVSSLALLPTTPLITSAAPTKIPLPLHTLLVYTTRHTNPPTTTRVIALDWGQVGLLTLLLELISTRRMLKRGGSR